MNMNMQSELDKDKITIQYCEHLYSPLLAENQETNKQENEQIDTTRNVAIRAMYCHSRPPDAIAFPT